MVEVLTSYPKWTSSKTWKQKWMSDTSRDWDKRREGFRKHIDAACGWAVVQLDHDKEEEPWYAIYGTMLAECRERSKEQSCGPSPWRLQA